MCWYIWCSLVLCWGQRQFQRQTRNTPQRSLQGKRYNGMSVDHDALQELPPAGGSLRPLSSNRELEIM